MKDVSEKGGRTVIFVSHNMEALLSLCPKSILLSNGKIANEGSTSHVIDRYLIVNELQNRRIDFTELKRDSNLKQNILFKTISLINDDSASWQIKYKEKLMFNFEIRVIKEVDEFEIGVALFNSNDFEIVSSLPFSDLIPIPTL